MQARLGNAGSKSNNVDSQAVADSSAVDSEIGWPLAVAINAATVFNQAYIGKNAEITAGELIITAGMTEITADDDSKKKTTKMHLEQNPPQEQVQGMWE